MSRSTLRIGILIFSLITAAIHLVLGVGSGDLFGVLFILNGLGYLALMIAILRPPEFLAGQERVIHYAFIAFTGVTILAWLFLNGDFADPIGVATKLDEILLIVALALHLRAES